MKQTDWHKVQFIAIYEIEKYAYNIAIEVMLDNCDSANANMNRILDEIVQQHNKEFPEMKNEDYQFFIRNLIKISK